VVAGLSFAGFVSLLFLLIGLQRGLEAGAGLILVLVAAFLQAALAIAQLLASAGVIRANVPAGYPPPPSFNGYPPRPR
jgi:hypothetical protein